jgi:trehalose synthase
VTEGNAAEFRELVKPKDVVVIHDPQPAGLIPAIRDIGCPTVWRCHVGLAARTRSRAGRGSS